MMSEGGTTAAERATYGFRLTTSRVPTAAESAVLARIYETQLKLFQANPQAAGQLLSYGEAPRNMSLDAADLAACTMVANVLLNLDETVTKE